MVTVWLSFILWPIVGIILFRKLNLPLAVCVTVIGGYLLLPEKVGIDLPMLPELNKHSIPALTAFFMTLLVLKQGEAKALVLQGWVPREPVALVLLTVLAIGAFGTALTNQDPLLYGPRFLPGMRLYDSFSILLSLGVMMVPMLLARRVLATNEGQRVLLTVLVVAAVLYSIPALWEVRMSPQLHRQFYGFMQHSFLQQMRGDGFRPMVFLSHGLTLAIFMSLAVLTAAGLMRAPDSKNRVKWCLAAVWLSIVLLLTKSLGALMITIALLPLVLFLKPRTQLLIAACIAGTVMTYPLLRAAGLIPVDRLMDFAESVDPQRARSLNVRLTNEEALLEKAAERPLFGWGGYSRNRLYSESGQDLSVTDGEWIIHLGTGGWVLYIGLFGLLCWPLIRLFILKRGRIDPICALLALVLCAKLIDLIPNSGVSPYYWLIAGSLLGRIEIKPAQLQGTTENLPPSGEMPLQYARRFRPASTKKPMTDEAATGPQNEITYTRQYNQRHVRKR